MYQGRPDSVWVKSLKRFSEVNEDDDIMFAIRGANYPRQVLEEVKKFLMTLPNRQKSIAEIDAKLTV